MLDLEQARIRLSDEDDVVTLEELEAFLSLSSQKESLLTKMEFWRLVAANEEQLLGIDAHSDSNEMPY